MMAITLEAFLFFLLFFLLCAVLKGENEAGPLFLTPYIESDQTKAGREAAKVTPLLDDVEGYSGFLTVDGELQKNLFFWYFPAEIKDIVQEEVQYEEEIEICVTEGQIEECTIQIISGSKEVEKDKTPVILWLQGGPGGTSMFGLLKENGPYQLMDDLSLKLREHRWSKSFHMLYIDSPVGTGFSFAEPGVYDKDEKAVSEDLYQALLQFFELFPDLDGNEFFIAGESYAGRYIPALGLRIHEENPTANKKINLTGLLIGDGIVDDEFMVYGDYLAQHGLIDLQDLPQWQKLEEMHITAVEREDYQTAQSLMITLLLGATETGVSLYNFLETKNYYVNRLGDFFNSEMKRKIHAGNTSFIPENWEVGAKLTNGDFFMKVSKYTEPLLENYKVMHYNGQLDIILHYPMAEAYTNSLEWSRSTEFQEAHKRKWVVDGQELAGYVKSGGNLYLVMVRDAGHMVPMDQPKWTFDLVTKFVNNNL